MKRAISTAAVAAGLLVLSAAPAWAGNGNPQRPGGGVEGPRAELGLAVPDNGGDNGWGNCGHNSSQGKPHTGLNGGGNGGLVDHCKPEKPGKPDNPGNGNGGDDGTCEATVTTFATVIVGPGDDGTTDPTDPSDGGSC